LERKKWSRKPLKLAAWACKIGAKKGMVSEEISTIYERPTTLHKNNRKDALRTFQELVKHHQWHA
jgi:hypothetical protein